MVDRITTGLSLARSTWRVLLNDKKLLLFPLISGILLLLVIASFAIPMVDLFRQGHLRDADGKWRIWVYPILFACYFCAYFVVIFCNAALVSCALLRFNDQEASVADGFRAAMMRHRQILGWAFVSASVGLLLLLIESANKRFGQLVARLLGSAWSILTFFVVPILVVENVGPARAIKESTSLLHKTWGETLIGRVGLGFFFLLLLLPIGALFVAGYYMLASDHAVGVGLLVTGGVCFLIYALLASAMSTVFLTAVYQYASSGRVPGNYEPIMLAHAFNSKLRK